MAQAAVHRPAKHAAGSRRVRTAVVDQHATWIAVNPIQGCPKACAYCFLNERGQTAVRPEFLAGPEEALDLLVASPFYAPRRPVAFYTWTDVMGLPDSRDHLRALLAAAARRRLDNPAVLITKCHIPPDVIDAVVAARSDGLDVVVYVSYSGLDRDIERGIRRDAVAADFPALAGAGIPVVHYWRPAFPESATEEVMVGVLDHAARYAACTVAAGLKVEPAALERMSTIWPQLAATAGVTEAECVYPRPFWEFIHRAWRRHPHYPLFHTNACALAYVLGRPDSFGIYGGQVCRLRNHCPAAQRAICAAAEQPPPSHADVGDALARRGMTGTAFTFDDRELVLDAPVATNLVAALTQDLGVRVRAGRTGDDSYWNSGTAGAQPVIIG